MTQITNELKDMILSVTGENRNDVIEKVAELLGGETGRHQVYTGSSNNIEWNGLVIDLSTKKKKGVQIVTTFFAWEKGDRSTIEMFF